MAGVAVRAPLSAAASFRIPLRTRIARQRLSQRTVAMAANVQDKIKAATASSPVVVFSKTYCPCVPRLILITTVVSPQHPPARPGRQIRAAPHVDAGTAST